MPGVPSNKGCDACVKQKKKCDRSQPACLRCARLSIPCIGAGRQRYKFLVLGPSSVSSNGPTSIKVSGTQSVLKAPRNGMTALLANFSHKLDVRDVRYDLIFTYGGLMREIPKRLGTNRALDTSVRAMVRMSTDLDAPSMSEEALCQFGKAVAALRLCVTRPDPEQLSLNLCAIFVIWVCQGWIAGETDNCVGHGAGVISLLATMPPLNPTDPFTKTLLTTLLIAVMVESIADCRVKPQPWMKAYVTEGQSPESDNDSALWKCVMRIPEFLRYDPSLLPAITKCYADMKAQAQTQLDESIAWKPVGDKQDKTNAERAGLKPPNVAPIWMYALHRRTYGLSLSVEVILCGILLAYLPEDATLGQEYRFITREIINLAYEARQWRPLAALWASLYLTMAWVATADPLLRSEVESAWCNCQENASKKPFIVPDRVSALFGELRYNVMKYGNTLAIV